MSGWRSLPLAALLAVLAAAALPLSPDDPFHDTLIVLPLILAALHLVGRWTEGHGGQPIPAGVGTTETVLLVALILLIIGRHHLGLTAVEAAVDGALAGGLALLLAHRLAWLIRALRPCLGRRLARMPPWPFFALPLIVYLAILPWSTRHHPPDGDEPHYLLLTHSLAHDFDTDLANNYEQEDSLAFMNRSLEPQFGDPVGRHGELYSRHNVLLPLVLAPAYRVAGLAGALVMMAVMTAGTCWLTLALAACHFRDRPGEALLAWSILSFSAPLLLFSYQVWVEVPAALLTLLALIQVDGLQRDSHSGSRRWLGIALPLVALPLLKIRFLLVAMPIALLAAWRARPAARLRLGLLLLGLLVLGVGILLFNYLVFQNPLKYHDIYGLRLYLQLPPQSYLRGLSGLFFDCAFGLFAYAPLWMLLLPAVVALLGGRSRLLGESLLTFLAYLLLLLPRGEWFGGWSPPFRYGIVMLPVLALWLVPALTRRKHPGARAVVALLLSLTAALTLLWVVEPGWTYNLAHGRSHLLDHLSNRLSADVARLFPSSTRPRAATTLWPPLVFVLINLVWWLPERRRPRAAVWGVAGALLLVAMVPWAAQTRASHVVEFEDSWISKSAGRVHPDLWVIYRPQYRGGWVLPEDARIEAPVVAGGTRLSLQVQLKPVSRRPATTLEVRSGRGEVLASVLVGPPHEWGIAVLEDISWSPGAPLILTLDGRAILDRARLDWR